MNKKFVFLAAVAMLLTACGNPGPTSETTTTTSDPTTVTTTSTLPTTDPTSVTSVDPTTVTPLAEYTVEFYVQGSVIETKTFKEGSHLTFPASPFIEGFKFTGWYSSPDCKDSELVTISTKVTGNMKIYAGFEEFIPQTVYVTFDANGGEFTGNTIVAVTGGELVERPVDPTKDGHTFEGWSLTNSKDDLFDFNTPVKETMTLYAVYKEVVVKAVYDITASSQANLDHRVEFAADEDLDTYWQARDEQQQELLIDLGEVMAVRTVKQDFVDELNWDYVILGSFDGTNYYELKASDDTVGTHFETTVTGYYRYVKLVVAPYQAFKASSREFAVEYDTIERGMNVFYGYKGVGDNSWSGGCEYEKMFDGREDTMYCAADGNGGHWYGASSKTDEYYVNDVEVLFHDDAPHKFSIDISQGYGASWPNLCNLSNNESSSRAFSFEVNDLMCGALIHYYGPHWANADELRGWGFKNLKPTDLGGGVLDLGNMSRVGVVELSNQGAGNIKLEVSTDGVTFVPVTVNADSKFVKVNKDARYVKYSSNDAGSSIRVFGISYITDLVLGKMLDADPGTEPGYFVDMATLNKECEAGVGRFYCRHYCEEGQIRADFGNKVYIRNIYLRTPDYHNNNVKMNFEVSNDGVNYTSVFNTYDEPATGQEWSAPVDGQFRYVRVSINFRDGWTSVNKLAIFGCGNSLL